MRAFLLGLVAVQLGCGGTVESADRSAGATSSGGSTGTSMPKDGEELQVAQDCTYFCGRFMDLGMLDDSCVLGCRQDYDDAGACKTVYATLLHCLAENISACAAPPACQDELDAQAACESGGTTSGGS